MQEPGSTGKQGGLGSSPGGAKWVSPSHSLLSRHRVLGGGSLSGP